MTTAERNDIRDLLEVLNPEGELKMYLINHETKKIQVFDDTAINLLIVFMGVKDYENYDVEFQIPEDSDLIV